jgi:hypothetical protein
MRDGGDSFQELADETFADLLKKRKQPVGLKAALKESVKKRGHKKGRRSPRRAPFCSYSFTASSGHTNSLAADGTPKCDRACTLGLQRGMQQNRQAKSFW